MMRILFLTLMCFGLVQATQKPSVKIYNYKTKDPVGLSIPGGVYMGQRQIGTLRSLREYHGYYIGKLAIEGDITVYCNMLFSKKMDLLNTTDIRVTVDSSNHCRQVVEVKDTIEIR